MIGYEIYRLICMSRKVKVMKLILNDCLLAMKEMPDNSVGSVVTDPPYGLSFMGKAWDYDVPSIDIWREVLRVLKPGGHLLSFAGSRTYHRMAVNIEDAGFEIRDMIEWVYGSGFPKSLNIGKAYDKKMGNERDIIGTQKLGGNAAQSTKEKGGTYASNTNSIGVKPIEVTLTKGSSPYEGWGTALKPAHEPIVMARKPLIGTVCENVIKYGTGGINIDGCRVGTEGGTTKGNPPKGESNGIYGNGINGACDIVDIGKGRFPANLIHDGSDEVLEVFPNNSARFFKVCKDTQKHAIMKVWTDIDVSIAKSNSTITQVIEKIMSITSALVSVPPNLS